MAAIAVASAAGAVAWADKPHHHGHGTAPAGSPSAFEREMHVGMSAMMEAMHAAGYSGDPDADFLAMMVPHHQGAIDMARLVLQHGSDPVTRRLAEEIIAGQMVEIESMQRRLAILRKSAGHLAAEYPSLSGTRGPQ